jgi:hypothetical protein
VLKSCLAQGEAEATLLGTLFRFWQEPDGIAIACTLHLIQPLGAVGWERLLRFARPSVLRYGGVVVADKPGQALYFHARLAEADAQAAVLAVERLVNQMSVWRALLEEPVPARVASWA